MGEKKKDLPVEIKVRREYFKEWRKNNKDKVKKHNQTFWKKQSKKMDNSK